MLIYDLVNREYLTTFRIPTKTVRRLNYVWIKLDVKLSFNNIYKMNSKLNPDFGRH